LKLFPMVMFYRGVRGQKRDFAGKSATLWKRMMFINIFNNIAILAQRQFITETLPNPPSGAAKRGPSRKFPYLMKGANAASRRFPRARIRKRPPIPRKAS